MIAYFMFMFGLCVHKYTDDNGADDDDNVTDSHLWRDINLYNIFPLIRGAAMSRLSAFYMHKNT